MGTHESGDVVHEEAPCHESIPATSQIEIEIQAHSQEGSHQGAYILSTAGSLDNLMRREDIPASYSPPVGGQSNGSSNEEPPKVRMIGDFDDGANALWTLYGKEAKSHDQSRIQTLKEDMDGVLIFVCSYSYFYLCRVLKTLIHYLIGWFILCCPHRIHRQ
jgi:hypothetical protein